jgi:hypothetical protein
MLYNKKASDFLLNLGVTTRVGLSVTIFCFLKKKTKGFPLQSLTQKTKTKIKKMNKTFQIKTNAFKETKKQLIIKSLPLLLISMCFGFSIIYFNSNDKEDIITILPFIIPIFVFAGAFGILKGLKRQKILLESYKLILSENNVIREQENTPTINIQFMDIKSIIKDKKENFTIKGKTTIETILIPAQIDNYENLEIILNQIKPIEEISQPTFDEKYRIPTLILTLSCMATVYISFNKILVGICGLILSSLLIRSFFQIKKNKNIDIKTKRIGYYSLVVLVSIVAVTIMKVTSN